MDNAPQSTAQETASLLVLKRSCQATGPSEMGRITSAKLLGGLRELEIEHGTERYRLRVTSMGKLILTK
jgi:hemin uptake protein HemP